MRKSVMAILLIVVLLICGRYAVADGIDLKSMSTDQLKTLKSNIETELNIRSRRAGTNADQAERRDKAEPFLAWNRNYDFDSMIASIDSPECSLDDACAKDVREYAEQASSLMQRLTMSADMFTGEYRITSPDLKGFAQDGCMVFPYISNDLFYMVVGFPYNGSAIHYTTIYMKMGETITQFRKNDSKYEIRFETFDNQSWEYSILTDSFAVSEYTMDAISFRDSDSVHTFDYIPTEAESEAVANVHKLFSLNKKIQKRLNNWVSKGE